MQLPQIRSTFIERQFLVARRALFRACRRRVNKRLSRLPEALVAQLGGDAGAGGSSCDYGGSYPPLALRIVPVGTEYISGIHGEIRDRFAADTLPLPDSVSACLLPFKRCKRPLSTG